MNSLQNSTDQENHSISIEKEAELTEKLSLFAKGVIETTSRAELNDYWVSYSDKIDINIWEGEDGVLLANAYDVIGGNTQVDHWVELNI